MVGSRSPPGVLSHLSGKKKNCLKRLEQSLWCMLRLKVKCCLCRPSDEPKSNDIVTQLVRFGNDAPTILYWHKQTGKNSHKDKRTHFLPHSKTNTLSLHYTWTLYLPLFVPVHLSTLLHSTLSFYLSTVCSYLSLHLLPWQSSLAMGLCPFIIHGVVLMARAAMSDVNLCASQAHSAYNASARGATTELTVLRYTEINTLTHTCKWCSSLHSSRKTIAPFLKAILVCSQP